MCVKAMKTLMGCVVWSRVLQWVPIPMGKWVGMRDPSFTTTQLADYRVTRRIVVSSDNSRIAPR